MGRVITGRAAFYTRDSGGRHETTPGEYVKWAQRKAVELNVDFAGTVEDIQQMIQREESAKGDIFLDFEVPGHELIRTGLTKLTEKVTADESYSHIFIPRRDRLARPNDPIDAMQIETEWRKKGLTIVFMDKVLAPLKHGRSPDFSEQLIGMLEYNQAAKFRLELSEKMVYCQIALARAGFSTGGRPPFAFDRWLATGAGEKVRQLADGEIVRMAGHHVIWLPATDERLELALRIRHLLKTVPAARLARQLNDEGIPSPDSGRFRTDNGVRHRVSGRWHATTIVNIGRCELLSAVVCYGTRSMGDQSRFTESGPRRLTDSDLRCDGKPKVVRNPESEQIQAKAKFEPVVSSEDHAELVRILDQRAGSQKGISRSRDPNRNPLGGRIYDQNCTWPMYRVNQKDSFRYRCGLYGQSKGQECDHNHVDGRRATEFVLSCVRQFILSPNLLPQLEARFRALAEQEAACGKDATAVNTQTLQGEIQRLDSEIRQANRNLAFARNETQFQAVSGVIEELTTARDKVSGELKKATALAPATLTTEQQVEKAMQLVQHLTKLAYSEPDLSVATELFTALDARLFLKFRKETPKKRAVNRVSTGILVFGAEDDPIQRYSGPTTPAKLKSSSSGNKDARVGRRSSDGKAGKSLRNTNRGDTI